MEIIIICCAPTQSLYLAKMLSANQIAGFLNMQYLQNELMK